METTNTNTSTQQQQEINDVLDHAYALLQEAYDLLLGLETSNCTEDFEYALECATEAVDEAQQRLSDCDASEALEMLGEDEDENS